MQRLSMSSVNELRIQQQLRLGSRHGSGDYGLRMPLPEALLAIALIDLCPF
jgi:hypothetical protein